MFFSVNDVIVFFVFLDMQIILFAFNDTAEPQCDYLQMVLEDQGNPSLHAVQADRRYRADQPNPEGLRGLGDPERVQKD